MALPYAVDADFIRDHIHAADMPLAGEVMVGAGERHQPRTPVR